MSDVSDLEREALRRLWAGEAPLVGDLRIGESEQPKGAMKFDPRHCASCGHLCDREGEFHPYLFCVIKKADPGCYPWGVFRSTARLAGLDTTHWPEYPPLVRDSQPPGLEQRLKDRKRKTETAA